MTLPASGALTLADIQTEFGGANPIGLSEYYAGGGLVPAGASGTYGAVPSSGAISVQNFYGTSAYTPVYIEELFSTYLYTGINTNQQIVNNINTQYPAKALVWIKQRSASVSGADSRHVLSGTNFGTGLSLSSNSTNALGPGQDRGLTAFNTNGFTVKYAWNVNEPGVNYSSWTFQAKPKFFDVVTWTGNGQRVDQVISHNLGSTPGCIIVKCTSNSQDWLVWHRATGNSNDKLFLNLTDAKLSGYGNGVQSVTSTSFVAAGNTTVTNYDINVSGRTYVAYLFAHNAGGFGLTGTDNVVSCGSFTTDSGGLATVNLGYEPQWLLVKCISNADHWNLMDQMRDWNMSTQDSTLYANLTNAESTANWGNPTATGFEASFGSSRTYIYIAIRRPHRVPTDASKVFGINLYSGTGSQQTITTPFNAPDAALSYVRNAGGWSSPIMYDKLRGSRGLFTDQVVAELASADYGAVISNNAQAQEVVGMFGSSSGKTYVTWSFARACGFFDVVCWTGNGGLDQVVTHGLGVTPSMLITKQRNGSNSWATIVNTGSGAYPCRQLYLNDSSSSTASFGNQSTATTCVPMAATGFGSTYVTYLFATCPGVSKVGSYTGTGTAQQIDCGFTSGARFVMIKRTDAAGSWLVFDSARGITAGNDPYLYLNSTTYGEITFDNFIHPYSAGFQLTNSPYGAEVNANGGSYIYLAIA